MLGVFSLNPLKKGPQVFTLMEILTCIQFCNALIGTVIKLYFNNIKVILILQCLCYVVFYIKKRKKMMAHHQKKSLVFLMSRNTPIPDSSLEKGIQFFESVLNTRPCQLKEMKF